MSTKPPDPSKPCKKCGEVHPFCLAHNRAGKACSRGRIDGGLTCNMHGSGAPQVKAAAARRVRTREVTAEAGAFIAHEGIEPIGDPLDELSKLAAAAQAMCDALGARVNYLGDLTSMDAAGKETIKAEVLLLERAMDRAARMLDMLVRAGFMERQVKIQEGTADAVVNVLQRIFARLALTPEQLDLLPVVVPEEMRALEM